LGRGPIISRYGPITSNPVQQSSHCRGKGGGWFWEEEQGGQCRTFFGGAFCRESTHPRRARQLTRGGKGIQKAEMTGAQKKGKSLEKGSAEWELYSRGEREIAELHPSNRGRCQCGKKGDASYTKKRTGRTQKKTKQGARWGGSGSFMKGSTGLPTRFGGGRKGYCWWRYFKLSKTWKGPKTHGTHCVTR